MTDSLYNQSHNGNKKSQYLSVKNYTKMKDTSGAE